jgi:hypothetical protein
MTIAWVLGCIRRPMSSRLWLFSKGIMGFLPSSLEGPGMWWMIFLLLLTQQVWHKFGTIWHVQIVFQNALNWSEWNFQYVSNSTDRVPLFSWTNSFILSTFSSVLLISGYPDYSASLADVTPLFLTSKMLRNLCSFHFLLSKPYF